MGPLLFGAKILNATIFSRTSVNALHHWPGATGRRSYLANPHMHTFNFEAHAQVIHNDRDIEFHDLRDMVDDAIFALLGEPLTLEPEVNDFGPMSCEAIGEALLERLPEAVFMIQVMEDDACGARVSR